MEWFWYITASIGAGIGTGLAGLSAATVMVPMLIVICPSFSGEIGAFQAAAVSPASAKTTVSAGKPIDVIDLRDPPADWEVPIEETMPPYEPIPTK